MLNLIRLLHCLAWSLFLDPDVLGQDKVPLLLQVGEQRILPIPDLKKYSLGSALARGTSLELPTGERGILIQALAPGATDVIVIHSDGRSERRPIWIEKNPVLSGRRELLKGLQGLQETEVFWSATGVLIRGAIFSPNEALRVDHLKKAFPKEVQDETVLSSDYILGARNRLDSRWQKDAWSFLILESGLDRNRITGQCPSRLACEKIRAELVQIDPRLSWEAVSLGSDDPTVFFKVYLIETSGTHVQELGMLWPESTAWSTKNPPNVDLILRALENRGKARILSRPEIAVRIPGEAELFSGGELPIRTSAQFFSNVQWKSFGLSLKLKVFETNGKKVRLEVQTEVSHLAPGVGEDPVPGLDANRLKTQVDADFQKPLLLSGLVRKSSRTQVQGLPGLSQIPILGPLIFGRESLSNEQAELVAILLPSLKVPTTEAPEGSRPLGHPPVARNFLSEEQIANLIKSPEYPWNAFSP